MNKIIFKSVNYSYPTSPNADKYNKGNAGYTVSLSNNVQPPKTLAGYLTKEEALIHARKLPNPWCPAYLKYKGDV